LEVRFCKDIFTFEVKALITVLNMARIPIVKEQE